MLGLPGGLLIPACRPFPKLDDLVSDWLALHTITPCDASFCRSAAVSFCADQPTLSGPSRAALLPSAAIALSAASLVWQRMTRNGSAVARWICPAHVRICVS